MENLMSLQPYIRQLRPRNESYVSPIDKIQNLVEDAVLTPNEFVKYGGKRASLFLKHINDGVPFETVNDGTTTIEWINDEDEASFQKAIGTAKSSAFDASLKTRAKFKPTFKTPKGKELTIKDLVKTAAYGGKGSSGEPSGADWESIITHHYNVLIGKAGADEDASAEVEEKWEEFDEIGEKIAKNFKEKLKDSSVMIQYGGGGGSKNVTSFWKNPAEGVRGGTSGTPKTDMYTGDYHISLKKAGGSQLASGTAEETMSTFYASLRQLGDTKEGNQKISVLMDDIQDNFQKLTTSYSKGQLEKIAKDPAKVKSFEDQEVIQNYITTEEFHKELNAKLDASLNNITESSSFKEWFIFEAMSGYSKFIDNTAKASVCMEFNANSGAVSQYYKVTNDGKKGGLYAQPKISGDIVGVAKKARIYAAWKSSGGNPYSSLRISNSNNPFDHNYDDTTLIGCIRKTIHEDKISHKFLTEETEQLDEFRFITRAFDRIRGLGKDAVKWLKNLLGKIMKAINVAFVKIKKMGKEMFTAIFKFIGISPDVTSEIPNDVNGFVHGMAD